MDDLTGVSLQVDFHCVLKWKHVRKVHNLLNKVLYNYIIRVQFV